LIVGQKARSQPPAEAGPSGREEALERVRAQHERILQEGETLFEVGEPSDAVFIVQSGQIEIHAAGAHPGARLVARVGPGEAIGETDTLLGRTRMARAVAVQGARVLRLESAVFKDMCLERADLAWRFLEQMVRRTGGLERRLGALGMDDLVRPMVCALLGLSRDEGEGLRAETSLRMLAEATGLTIRDAHEALQELFEAKLVRLDEDALAVPDPDGLRARLAGTACASPARRTR